MGSKARKVKIPKLSADQLAAFWDKKSATFEKRMNLTPEEIKVLGKDNKR